MTTGRINQVTTISRPKDVADRRGRQGSSPRCDRSRGMGHGSETGSEAPTPEQTSFENPQTDVHEATTGRMPGVAEPTIERAIWGEGPGPNPPMASKVFKQTFGHRPSIHQLSHKDGRLDVHPSRGVETAHHGSKTDALMPWMEGAQMQMNRWADLPNGTGGMASGGFLGHQAVHHPGPLVLGWTDGSASGINQIDGHQNQRPSIHPPGT